MTLTPKQIRLVDRIFVLIDGHPITFGQSFDGVRADSIILRDDDTGHVVGIFTQEEGAWLFEPAR